MTLARHVTEHAILGVDGSVADLHAHIAQHVALGNRSAADIGAHLIAHAILGVVVGAGEAAEAYWIATLGGSVADIAYDIAVDADGNIYIAGYTASQGAGSNDCLIAKYNSAGVIQWQRSLGGAANDYARGIAVDADGNIYIAGYTASQGAGSNDCLIAKYNSAGVIQWQRSLGGTSGEIGSDIAVDADGNIYFVGNTASQGAGSDDCLIAKYNSAGVIQWQRSLGGTGIDVGNAVAVTPDGGLVVLGSTASQGAGSNDCLIAKYNSAGVIQWQRSLGGTGVDVGNAVAVTPDGGLVVLGSTASQGAGSNDCLIAKYNSAGVIQWQRSLGGAANDYARGIAVDADGNIYFVGNTASQGAGSNDCLIAKYNSAGVIQWQRSLGGTGGEIGSGIAIAPSGALVVVGETASVGEGGSDLLIAKLPADGSLTGTYGGLTYAATTLTDSARTLTDAATTLTDSARTLTDAARTLTDAERTLTSNLVAVE